MSGIIGTSHSKSKVIGRSKDTAKAWGRIEDNVLTNNHGLSGISVSSTGGTRDYVITMSPPMVNGAYCVVTTGYAHEGGQVEGLVQWYTGGGSTFSVSQFTIRYTGNGTPHINCIGFAVFGT